ncbi:MAG: hypothetical protein UV67_C0007G0028 [Parcubacteria group bacterium GW2011_GWC1_43_12]|nr:MAG: hypothetical protein UV67_C0007G0028 [Parcubacteria group bacterium GW2011_GWC1_43_12]
MNISHSFKTAIIGLKTNKSRSILTILGIVIGITAIILVMSLGEGAQNLILSEVQSIGSKTIGVSPGRHPTGFSDVMSLFADSLKEKDLEVLGKKTNVPYAEKIIPIVFGSESVIYGNESYRATVYGVSPDFAGIYNIQPQQGRIFEDEEVKSKSDVAVLGYKVKDELFGDSDALNEKIKIKGKNFRVIGVLPKKGQSAFVNFDDALIIPYTTAQQYIFGIKFYHRLVVEADSEKNVDQTADDIVATLRNSHDITDPEKDDFFVETQAGAMEQVSTIINILTLFLAAVAAISLLVGGVGIMNIMLVSVTERTREIGLRKALGAKSAEILWQFLLESITLTVLGGIIGITLGAFFSFLTALALSRFAGLDWKFIFPISAALLGLGVSAGVGLVFGLYPARQAAKKSPMEALRYE